MNNLMNLIGAAFSAARPEAEQESGSILDVLDTTSVPALVAEHLVRTDSVPATRSETVEAFAAITGHAPDLEDFADTTALLDSFGWFRS